MDEKGLITQLSKFSVAETLDRLTNAVAVAGMRVFARIDHAAGAAEVDMPLRPTELVVFGNPQGGTPLMQDKQTAGLDLPMKALIWEDEEGNVWLTYNDSAWIAERHRLGSSSSPQVAGLGAALAKLVRAATVS